MVRIRRLLEVHERLVMRDVVADVYDGVVARKSRVVLPANRSALAVLPCGREATLDPAPADSLGVEQVATVLARDRDHVGVLQAGACQHAIVKAWPWVADDRPRCAASRQVPDGVGIVAVGTLGNEHLAGGVSGDEIQVAGSRG